MGDYVKKCEKTVYIDRQVVEKTSGGDVNIEDMAEAIAEKILKNMPRGVSNTGDINNDDFNNSSSLERLADSMIVQRGEKGSNFDNLGTIHESSTDASEIDDTINLLSGLED